MRSFPVSLDEIEEHLNAIDGCGALELEHVIAMKRYACKYANNMKSEISIAK